MTSTLTVRDLFVSTRNGKLDAEIRLPPPPGGLPASMTGLDWQRVGDRVLDLLDINVVDVLVGGWKAHQDVMRELRLTAEDPSRTAVVQLAHHVIESTHAPSMELRVQGRKLLELSFPVELTIEIDAVDLTLRRGTVHEIRAGEVNVRGTVKLENTVLLERKLAPIALPGRIVLDTPAAEAAADGSSGAAA